MVEIKQYHLRPTALIPNSPRPLLHYKRVLPTQATADNNSEQVIDVIKSFDTFEDNGWKVAWLNRYGPTQPSHFHSEAHECMGIISGTASIRFGAADTSDDLDENTTGSAWEDGGVVLEAEAGDVFVIPSGVAHKTHNTKPEAAFKFLASKDGHAVDGPDRRKTIADIGLQHGFTMLGAYNNGDWDFLTSGGNYEKIWSVPKPENDPVFGASDEGLCQLWPGSNSEAQEGQP